MLNYDFSPFYRSTIGFDRLFTLLDKMRRPRLERPELSALQHRAHRRKRLSHYARGRRLYRKRTDGGDAREYSDRARRQRGVAEGRRRQARHALSGHRRARLRAPVPLGRPRDGDARELRERIAAHRPRARSSRSPEAAHDRDSDRWQSHRRHARGQTGGVKRARARRGRHGMKCEGRP